MYPNCDQKSTRCGEDKGSEVASAVSGEKEGEEVGHSGTLETEAGRLEVQDHPWVHIKFKASLVP